MKFIVSKKNGPHGILLVITDAEILGKTFEEERLQLDLSKEFYQGEKMDVEEVKQLISDVRHLHLTGKEAITLGIELGFVNKERILWVSGVPHAEVVVEE